MVNVEEGSWYLVRVLEKRRNLFLKYLEITIEQSKLETLILKIITPQEAVLENIVLLCLSNLKDARPYLQKLDYFQKIEPKPLTAEQVKRMAGES